MVGLKYGIEEVVVQIDVWMKQIVCVFYFVLVELVKEKGVFLLFDKDKFFVLGNMFQMDQDVCDVIVEYGI